MRRLSAWGLGLMLLGVAQPLPAQTVNRIVAIVNEAVITEADVMSQVNAILEAPEESPASPSDPQQVQRVVLRRLVEQQLLLQEARKFETSVSSEDVAARLQQVRARAGSEAAFRQWLEDANLSEEHLKERLREQLMVQQLIDSKIRATITVSPHEIASEVAKRPEVSQSTSRMRLSGLLIRTGARERETAQRLAHDLRQRLLDGADLAALAREHSEDAHAQEGGDMGWVAEGELLPELDAAVKLLAPGELSPLVETRLGFHLLRLVDRRSASTLSLREAHRAIYEQLYQLKFQQRMDKWLNELKRSAYIELPGLPQ